MIILKTDEEITGMREAGHFAWQLLEEMQSFLKPGISTQDIDDYVSKRTKERGGICAPFKYKGFPRSVCTSVNEVVCHGIPSATKILKEGDIINVDVTPIIGGYHGDASRSYPIGKISAKARQLIDCAKHCLFLGIGAVKEGARVGDIGAAIQTYAESLGFSVVREFVGHGIGKNFHESPSIPHYGKAGKGARLLPGMVFTIEPMINEGVWQCETLKDGWTAVTLDRKLSAQFEHTIAIRSDWQIEILTAEPGKNFIIPS